jgi:hypothetical protein
VLLDADSRRPTEIVRSSETFGNLVFNGGFLTLPDWQS